MVCINNCSHRPRGLLSETAAEYASVIFENVKSPTYTYTVAYRISNILIRISSSYCIILKDDQCAGRERVLDELSWPAYHARIAERSSAAHAISI